MELKRMNKESLWTIFDLDDYETVKNFPYTWHSYFSRKAKSDYCVATQYFKDENGNTKRQPMYLAVYLLNPDRKPNLYIDHINHDSLNNRRCNLRISSNENNSKNRETRNSNNKSGYRNVACVKKSKHPYWVQIVVNGRNTTMGKFDDVHKAGEFAEKMREKYYKEYAGKE